MDDSGILHKNDKVCIYGGIVFTSKVEQENFERKYNSILNRIKCAYCRSNKNKCKHKCPEIKDTNIKQSHKRWIWNLIRKELCYAAIIDNNRVLDSIMSKKQSRGRYRDYVQRIMIKLVLKELINTNKINPNHPVKLIIRIDQQATVTNTNRNFVDDIIKELKVGMFNFEYNKVHEPILFSDLEVNLKYVVSHKHISIQASDLISGETRKIMLINEDIFSTIRKLEYLDVRKFFP